MKQVSWEVVVENMKKNSGLTSHVSLAILDLQYNGGNLTLSANDG